MYTTTIIPTIYGIQMPELAVTFYDRNAELKDMNPTLIEGYDSDTGEYLRSFNSYEEFHQIWPSAEICGMERTPGGGVRVYCESRNALRGVTGNRPTRSDDGRATHNKRHNVSDVYEADHQPPLLHRLTENPLPEQATPARGKNEWKRRIYDNSIFTIII
ncbi:MAG: hypothetical protein IJU29_08545 [Oscillospiraceae bacterium]|nr:hypothetical protein [Oscillospiraceae bacterium]